MKRNLVVATFGLLVNIVTGCSDGGAPAAAAPEVYVAEVVQKDVPIYMEIVGQTQGSQDVDIRARVEGFLDSINFSEGSFVRKGDLLYQIDPKPLEAALAQARANLANSQARLDQATITVNRMKPLAEQQAVSLQELDNALANQNSARVRARIPSHITGGVTPRYLHPHAGDDAAGAPGWRLAQAGWVAPSQARRAGHYGRGLPGAGVRSRSGGHLPKREANLDTGLDPVQRWLVLLDPGRLLCRDRRDRADGLE